MRIAIAQVLFPAVEQSQSKRGDCFAKERLAVTPGEVPLRETSDLLVSKQSVFIPELN